MKILRTAKFICCQYKIHRLKVRNSYGERDLDFIVPGNA